jgi:hypothetical protein
LFADLDIHEVLPSGFVLISQQQIRRPLSMQYCAERRCFIKRGAPAGGRAVRGRAYADLASVFMLMNAPQVSAKTTLTKTEMINF